MKLSAKHLKRYKEIAGLLWKYGRSDLAQKLSVDDDFASPSLSGSADISPAELANDLEAMGPTYVKLGQMLAGRPDLLPEPYLKALARLQDRVTPFPFAQVEEIVMTELGVRISKAFARFDPEPLAAASLGQVHLAALRDGRAVVVKVQRPDIRPLIAEDFEILEQIAAALDNHTDVGHRVRFGSLVEEFRFTIQQELNYEREAQNLISVGSNLKKFPLLVVPQPVLDYCTRSVLTMDYIPGAKITALGPLARIDRLDGAALAEEMFKAYLKQVLVDGLFHADPHPGNVFITPDGHLALLDLGMVGHIAPAMQEHLLKLLLEIAEGNGEEAADIVIRISEKSSDFDQVEFRHRIGQIVALRRDRGLHQFNIGQALLEVGRQARDNGVFVPGELALLGKTLLQLNEIGQLLDSAFDPTASVRRNASELMLQRLRRHFTMGNMFSSLIEIKEFVGHLPTRLNRLLDAVVNSELEVNVHTADAKTMLDGMQKIANRITAGIILAALIVGASLLMRVQTTFRMFGYPGFAMLCFLAAAAGGFWLVVKIFVQDYKSRKKMSE